MWLPLLVVAALSGLCSGATIDYCRAKDPNPFVSFVTHAAYEASGANLDPTPVNLPGCRPVYMWHIGRHGTRYGKAEQLKSINQLTAVQDKIRENIRNGHNMPICQVDLENILNWVPTADPSKAMMLSEQGRIDQMDLGQRLKERFPDILANKNTNEFEVKYSDSPRCIDSAKWFMKGLTGDFPHLGAPEPLLRFHKKCPKYLALLATRYALGPYKKFEKGTEMNDVVTRVSNRLGFYQNLDYDTVKDMYEACSFELAWNWSKTKISPWCGVFGPEDFKVLEYFYDMKESFRTGYGLTSEPKLGCVLIKRLVRDMQARVNGGSKSSAIFHFTHDTIVNQMLAFMGIFHDDIELLPENFRKLVEERKWRVTKFGPFASNVHAVLYQCTSGEDYRVQLYLNENPLHLDGCSSEACTWSEFLAKYGSVPDTCKQARLCWLP